MIKTKELMMNKIRISLFICFTCIVNTAFAVQSIDELVNQDKLSLSVTVAQKEQQIVGQALIISIEVATDRWFATGSRVQSFVLPNVVMQANNIITINGSKRIKGQTWAMQTHEITLYPTLAGNYTLPALNVDVSVNTENGGIVSGVLSTQETNFTIVLPEALIGIDNFIVSPEVTLTIEGQFDVDKKYAVGEAVTQTITVTANDTPAMMIPEINLLNGSVNARVNKESNEESNVSETVLDGISIYQKTAQVFDKYNRGSLLGSRVESFTYIFEKSGNYILPERIIYWWNSQSNTLEKLVIPSSSWVVSNGGLSNINQTTYNISNIKFSLRTVIILSVSLFIAIVFVGFYVKRQHLVALYKKITHYEQRKLRQNFLNSIANKKSIESTQYLYQYALIVNKYAEVKSLPLTEKLNQCVFQPTPSQEIAINFSLSDAKRLIKQIDNLTKKKMKEVNFAPDKAISLNKK
jgi:hypothetical protein